MSERGNKSILRKSDKIKIGLVVLALVAFAASPLIFGMERVLDFIDSIFDVVFAILFFVVIAIPWAINAIFTDFK